MLTVDILVTEHSLIYNNIYIIIAFCRFMHVNYIFAKAELVKQVTQ